MTEPKATPKPTPQSAPPQWTTADTALYLTYAPAFVPRRAEQLAAVCAAVSAAASPDTLELGSGDGLLAEMLLDGRPDIRVTAVDGSEEMIEAARARLRRFGSRVRFLRADLADSSWRTGRYGAVVTSLAVHHLDHAEKRRLFRAVHGLLVPGGVFAQADMYLPTATNRLHAAREWDRLVLEQSEAQFGDGRGAAAFASAGWNGLLHPDPVDKPAPVADQLAWLAAAGFGALDVPWATAGHCVIVAARPEEVRS